MPPRGLKGSIMKYKTNQQFRLQMRGEPDWLYQLKQVEWAEGMVRLGGLTKADVPSVQWKHNAPFNSQFLGAQQARSGEDY